MQVYRSHITSSCRMPSSYFFFNDTATTEIYTLSLHDALPIWSPGHRAEPQGRLHAAAGLSVRVAHDSRQRGARRRNPGDRKSTRLNSSHMSISYAVFCLKKKKEEVGAAAALS